MQYHTDTEGPFITYNDARQTARAMCRVVSRSGVRVALTPVNVGRDGIRLGEITTGRSLVPWQSG